MRASLRIRPETVNRDLPAPELNEKAWSDCRNQYFRGAGSIRAEGYADILNPALLDTPFWTMFNRARTGESFWLYAGASSLSVTDFSSHFDLTPVGGMQPTEPGDYVGTTLNSIALLTNGKDAPWYWGGHTGTPAEALPGWPENTTCGFIRGYRYNAIAGDITANGERFENQFYWSASVEPGGAPVDWTPLPSNDAGDNILASTQGALVDGSQLRDYFILAKNHSLYLLSWVGGQFVFNVTELSKSVGAIARSCMEEHHGLLYIFTDGDIVVTDGSTIKSIANIRVRRTIFAEMNQAEYRRCFVVPYLAKNQMWFCYPVGDSTVCNRAAIYALDSDSWGFRDLPELFHAAGGITPNLSSPLDWDSATLTWEESTEIWDEAGYSSALADGVIMASDEDAGHLYGVDFAATQNGEPMPGSLLRQGMDFGDAEHVKLVNEVRPNILGTEGLVLQIRVGAQMQDSDPVRWSAPQAFRVGTDSVVSVTEKGRLIALEIQGDTIAPWRCYGATFGYRRAGRF